MSPPERSGAAEEIPQVLACQPLQRTEGEPPASRLIGTKLGTSKIPFFLTGEGKEGKVSRATFLRESIPGVNQYVTFLLPQYRIRNEMPNWQRKTVTFWNEKDCPPGHSNGGTNVGLWRGLQAHFMKCHVALDNLPSLGCSGSLSMWWG